MDWLSGGFLLLASALAASSSPGPRRRHFTIPDDHSLNVAVERGIAASLQGRVDRRTTRSVHRSRRRRLFNRRLYPPAAAPAPGALAPLMPRPNVPAEAPPVAGRASRGAGTGACAHRVRAITGRDTRGGGERQPPRVRRQRARRHGRPPPRQKRTPQVQGTPTGPAPSVTAPAPSATQPATTPTPKQKQRGTRSGGTRRRRLTADNRGDASADRHCA